MANIIQRLFGAQINREVDQQVGELKALTQQYLETLSSQAVNQMYEAMYAQLRQYGGSIKYNGFNQDSVIREGYAGNTDVYSLVRLIGQTGSTIPLFVAEIVDDGAYKDYRAMMEAKSFDNPKVHVEFNRARKKALQPVGPDNALQQLIDRPNNIDPKAEFYAGAYIYRLLTGNTYIYRPVLQAGAQAGQVEGLYLMPPQFTGIMSMNVWPRRILGYQLLMQGVNLLETDEVMHLKYFNPIVNWADGDLFGLSPLHCALLTMAESKEAAETMLKQFQNQGPAGVLGIKDMRPDAQSLQIMGQLKQKWETEAKGSKIAGSIKLSPGEPVFTRFGLSPVDLNVIEGRGFTQKQLANIYHVSNVLLNSDASSTESNVKEARKGLYTNAVLPEVYALRDAFNKDLCPIYSRGNRLCVEADISGITELQPDAKLLADWLQVSFWITPNEKRAAQKYEAYPDPSFDEPWMPAGYTPLSDAIMPALDNIADPNLNDFNDANNVNPAGDSAEGDTNP